MPNGNYILNDLHFDKEIEGMKDRDLMEFTAKLSYSNAIRIYNLEARDKKTLGLTGGIGVFIGGLIIGVIEYCRLHFWG